MAPKTATWAIYARQSLDRTGAGLAVERQIEDCRKLGRKLKLAGEPVIYTDNDISASSGKRRPEYERLLDALRLGKHRELIVWHTDRLHRRPLELEEFIAVAEARKVVTHTVQAGELDLATPSGRMVARMLGAAARQEVEHKAERRARAIQQSAGQGRRHGGGRSFGYGQTVIGEDGKRRAVDIEKVNRRESAAIRAAFDAILRGESTTSIWKSWNKRGLTTQHGSRWNGSTFRNMVKRPSLAGMVTYKGEVLEGVESAWPAIVPVDKWRAVQAIISDPARRTSPGNQPRHLCSGVVFCECGLPLRAGTNSIKSKRTGKPRRYTVYRCSADAAGHSTILKHVLDARVRDAVVDALYRAKDKPPPVAHTDEDDAALVEMNTELSKAQGALRRLADAIADDIITPEDARVRSTALRVEVARLTEGIEKLTRRVASVGVEDATWEALWAGIDPSGDVFTANDDGTQRFHAGRALLQAAMRDGTSEAEAKMKLELARRFDDLSLDQQRALVKSHVRVTVRATGRGSRPADRIDVERL